MKVNYTILILVFLTLSCNNNPKKESTRIVCMSPNSHSTQEEEKIKRIVYYGDSLVYQAMFDDYDDDFHIDEFLSYSLIMANKYDFAQAYYDVFYILTMLTQINSEECDADFGYFCLDEKTQQMALSYFKQAIYKGNIYASERLLNEFDKGKPFEIKELYLDKKLLNKAEQNITLQAGLGTNI